jgi:hypothetical protein
MANIKRANTSGITKTGVAIADVPDAPTIGAVADLVTGGGVTVAFTPAVTGGTATTFTATSSPGGITGTGSSPITVTGLTVGTAYTFTVTGTNSTATGPASAASASVTPTLAPLSAFDSIATATVGAGGTPSITFSSIPSTYTHLQIRGIARIAASQKRDSLKLTFNSDTGANYARHSFWWSGSAASTFSETSTNYVIVTEFAAATATASIFGTAITDVLDYTNTNKYTTVRSLGAVDLAAAETLYNGLNSGVWMNTAAITSITLTPFSGSNLVEYSSFALYGIKGN